VRGGGSERERGVGGGRRGGRGPAGGAGAGGGRPAAGPAPPAGGWADLPRDLLEAVARAVPAGDRLWFRLVCRRWVAAGAEVAPAAGGKRPPPGEVTRTRGAEAAASVARAKIALGALDGSARERFKSGLCRYAAKGGHLAVLQWARAQGYPWDERTCAWAAENGHLDVLQWARAHGCPWEGMTCEMAAKNGHLAVLQWARAKGCPWGWRTCAMAARNGYLEVLQWARARGCPWNDNRVFGMCEGAAYGEHLKVLKWARAKGCD